jgi:hypothetical protein
VFSAEVVERAQRAKKMAWRNPAMDAQWAAVGVMCRDDMIRAGRG